MAKANLRSQKLLQHTTLARDAAGEAGSTVAEIIETYHDTKAKTIRGKEVILTTPEMQNVARHRAPVTRPKEADIFSRESLCVAAARHAARQDRFGCSAQSHGCVR
jgi:hypothetical protein